MVMSRTDDVLERAQKAMRGVGGRIAMVRETQRDLSRKEIQDWVRRLRLAAEVLEEGFLK